MSLFAWEWKIIFISMASHLASLWNRGLRQLPSHSFPGLSLPFSRRKGAATETSLKKWSRATLSHLFHLVRSVKYWQFLLELNFKRLYRSSGKEKGSRCLVFTSSTKREIRHFHVVVVQWRQRNVQKSVMHVQSCCLANLNPLFFLPFSLTSPSSLLVPILL